MFFYLDKKMTIFNYLNNKLKYIISECSWRNIFRLDTLLKLLFMYCVIVSVLILSYWDYSNGAFSDNDKTKIAIYSARGRIGEHQLYLKTLNTLQKLDIEYIGFSLDETMANYCLSRPFFKSAFYIMHKLVKPRFSISLTHHTHIVPPGYSLVYLNVPDVNLFGTAGKFLDVIGHLKEFDGYIDLYSFVHGENPALKEVLKNEDKENAPILPAYLSQDIREFHLPSSYNYAVVTGTIWGCNRSSYRLISALKMLGAEDKLKAYGMSYSYSFMGQNYLGPLEKYGNPMDAVINVQRDGGIALIFHNFEHLIQGLPTSRIAEAIMSGSIVISDQHPFLRKYFGENILYFNSFGSAEEIYNEIKSHIIWVQQHPEKAREMSKSNYEIFSKELSLEIQLQKVIKEVEEYLK